MPHDVVRYSRHDILVALMNRQIGGLATLLAAMTCALAACGERARPATDTAAATPVASGRTVAAAPLRSPMSSAAGRTASPASTSPRPATAPAPTQPPRAGTDTSARRADTTKTGLVAQQPQIASPAPAVTAPSAPPAPSRFAVALARLPFENQERFEYQVKYGFLGVGSAVLEVVGIDSVRGTPAVHTAFSVSGGVRVYHVDDHYESWFDPISFSTLRAIQNIHEGSYNPKRQFEFFPERRTFSENGKPESETLPVPMDEISFLFFLRTIPLEVGKTYEFTRYFRPDKNPVRVIVDRKEHIRVPAGEFNTIVVRPVIKTTGLFGEGGRAEVWFTDDTTRTLVQLKSSLKFGSLNLYLRNRRAGTAWEGATTIASPSP